MLNWLIFKMLCTVDNTLFLIAIDMNAKRLWYYLPETSMALKKEILSIDSKGHSHENISEGFKIWGFHWRYRKN